jgi:hypothetical protein
VVSLAQAAAARAHAAAARADQQQLLQGVKASVAVDEAPARTSG